MKEFAKVKDYSIVPSVAKISSGQLVWRSMKEFTKVKDHSIVPYVTKIRFQKFKKP